MGIEAVEGSDEDSITVRTEAVPVETADGECKAAITPRADEYEGQSATIMISIEVRADRPRIGDVDARDANGFPISWEGCVVEPRVVTIELKYPVGRPVADPFGSQFWIQDGRWVGCDHVVMTCNVDPASCDNSTLHDTIANSDIPRHFRTGNKRCEEPFAVVDVDYGAGDCPVSGDPTDNPCAGQKVRRMYWRIEDDKWVVIGTDDGPGRIAQTAPDFPSRLCRDLPVVAP